MMKRPIGKIPEHTRVDDAWIPVGFDAIEALDTDRRMAHHPASWVEVKLWVWLKAHRGAPPSVRAIQDWAQWSKHQASEVRRVVVAQAEEWTERFGQNRTQLRSTPYHVGSQNRTVVPNDSDNLGDPIGHVSAVDRSGFGQESSSCARSSYTNTETSTENDMGETPKPPSPKSKKSKPFEHGTADVRLLWEALNQQRKIYRPGTSGIVLQKSWAATLRDQLKISAPGEIIRAYRYFNEAEDARWWQDKKLDLGALMTQRTLERMMAESTDWSPAKEAADRIEENNNIEAPF
jgi:hypothetical protein